MSELITRLREQAQEIAINDIPGWGNTMLDAANIIEQQAVEIAALREQLTKVRMEAIGWMYSYACNEMDCDRDIRITEVPKIIEQVLIDLGEESK